MDRNLINLEEGIGSNSILIAAGMNFRKLPRWLAVFFAYFMMPKVLSKSKNGADRGYRVISWDRISNLIALKTTLLKLIYLKYNAELVNSYPTSHR